MPPSLPIPLASAVAETAETVVIAEDDEASVGIEATGTAGSIGAVTGAGGVETAALAACSAEAVAPVASDPSASARLM